MRAPQTSGDLEAVRGGWPRAVWRSGQQGEVMGGGRERQTQEQGQERP